MAIHTAYSQPRSSKYGSLTQARRPPKHHLPRLPTRQSHLKTLFLPLAFPLPIVFPSPKSASSASSSSAITILNLLSFFRPARPNITLAENSDSPPPELTYPSSSPPLSTLGPSSSAGLPQTSSLSTKFYQPMGQCSTTSRPPPCHESLLEPSTIRSLVISSPSSFPPPTNHHEPSQLTIPTSFGPAKTPPTPSSHLVCEYLPSKLDCYCI